VSIDVDWWKKPRIVSVVVDNPSWFEPYGEDLAACLCRNGDEALLVRNHVDVPNGAVAFYLSCIHRTPTDVLARNRRNLVVHASDLPHGRGFSPLTWQILEGKNQIPICLFEAVAEIDAGPVVYREVLSYDGHELIDELREGLGRKTISMCLRFLNEQEPPVGDVQIGEPSLYPRRRPPDSRLEPTWTIAEQFNQLRVVDNDRYPAWFEWAGHQYRLTITKMKT
jgi:methionyl-tRNA formyltransferase